MPGMNLLAGASSRQFGHNSYNYCGGSKRQMKRFLRQFRWRCAARGTRGITLVEVLAAMTILALGLLALMPMAVTTISANGIARETRGAMEQIQNRMERFRLQDSVVAGTEIDSTSGMSTSWWTEDAGTNLKKLVIEVNWAGDDGMAHRQRGSALLYKKS